MIGETDWRAECERLGVQLRYCRVTRAAARAALEELGAALAGASHEWTPRQRKAWEKTERLLRS